VTPRSVEKHPDVVGAIPTESAADDLAVFDVKLLEESAE
jgi:hypothetical protein